MAVPARWAGRSRVTRAGVRVAGRALSPFSWPFHHFPWDRPGQKPQLLTSTGARARKVVKGAAPGTADRARMPPGPGNQTTRDVQPGVLSGYGHAGTGCRPAQETKKAGRSGDQPAFPGGTSPASGDLAGRSG